GGRGRVGLIGRGRGEPGGGVWTPAPPAAVKVCGSGEMPNTGKGRGRPAARPAAGHAATVGDNPPAVIVGKLTPKRRITGAESAVLRQHAGGPYKITIPSPTWELRGYIPGTSDRADRPPADTLRHLADTVHPQVTAILPD